MNNPSFENKTAGSSENSPMAPVVRVLAVDDELAILDLYRSSLIPGLEAEQLRDDLALFDLPEDPAPRLQSRFTIEVCCCQKAEEAIDSVRQAERDNLPFSVALIDMRLPPGPDGLWVAQQIRHFSPETEIVIITAYTNTPPEQFAEQLPPDHKLLYLQKPVHPYELRQLVFSLSNKFLTERALMEAKLEAETASRAKSVFLASVSHELRTPLTSILGFVDLCKRPRYGELSAQQQDFLDVIHRNGQYLLALINDILDIAKIESGQLEYNLSSINLAIMLEDCVRSVEDQIKKKKLSFRSDIGSVDRVTADERRLRQCVLNLLDNAIKYTPSEGRIGLVAAQQDEEIIITVWDTGPGIPANYREEIFQEFFRIPEAEKEKQHHVSGTGLGLALTKRFMELQKGRVWVESEPGMGSRFNLALPHKPARDPRVWEHASKDAGQSDLSCNHYSILIVEDEPDIRNMLEMLLEIEHFDIHTACCGQEGLEMVQKHHPDLVLLDIKLPDISGIHVLRKIRTELNLTQLPVIAVTARALKNNQEEYLQEGFDAFVSKPIQLEQFFDTIHRILSRTSREK